MLGERLSSKTRAPRTLMRSRLPCAESDSSIHFRWFYDVRRGQTSLLLLVFFKGRLLICVCTTNVDELILNYSLKSTASRCRGGNTIPPISVFYAIQFALRTWLMQMCLWLLPVAANAFAYSVLFFCFWRIFSVSFAVATLTKKSKSQYT